MNTEFYTFGEILWDCLPSGRHAGGAPFNVAGHIAQLGVSVSLLSSVGQDGLGDEILAVATQKGVNVGIRRPGADRSSDRDRNSDRRFLGECDLRARETGGLG